METYVTIESAALKMTDQDREQLALRLLDSLPEKTMEEKAADLAEWERLIVRRKAMGKSWRRNSRWSA